MSKSWLPPFFFSSSFEASFGPFFLILVLLLNRESFLIRFHFSDFQNGLKSSSNIYPLIRFNLYHTFLNLGHPRPLFPFIFVFFNNKHFNFKTNKCKKCPSSIWCWDSNPQRSEHQPLPITTRPGLPPNCCFILLPIGMYFLQYSVQAHHFIRSLVLGPSLRLDENCI